MAKCIMVQGTMSSAGKSLFCTALCRLFSRDGYRVAPFKSQNMSRNAHVTRDGLVMSRAQAVQAEACGREPTADMNPLLLKPVTDMGSELFVRGRSRGILPARDYFAMKTSLIPTIEDALARLDAENDILVLEGAGSPAEINLKQDDIVNMGLAKLARAPVLLVGDIDRGGVFAQLAGTLLLLEEDERTLVKATVINKFRGDPLLLQPGLDMLQDITQKPVLGVLPYLDADIEDEDSLSARERGESEELFGRRDELDCPDYRAYRHKQYDILADALRRHMDIPMLYRILEEGL